MAHSQPKSSKWRRWFEHPLTQGLDLDNPHTTVMRREILKTKPFLRSLYADWYRSLAAEVPSGEGAILELGSGAGFLREMIPGLVSSDILAIRGIDVVLDGCALPIRNGALKALLAVNVLHHIASPRRFLREAERAVRPGGALILLEPWLSNWGRLIYRRVHHEPCDPDAPDWTFPAEGPLSGANVALPWILFARDRKRLEAEFPSWRLVRLMPRDPLCYLLSGGISMRNMLPGWSYRLVTSAEVLLKPWMDKLAMFAMIVLKRQEVGV